MQELESLLNYLNNIVLLQSFINATFPSPLACSLITKHLMQSVSHLLKMMWKDKLKPVPSFPQNRGRLRHSPSSPLFRWWWAGWVELKQTEPIGKARKLLIQAFEPRSWELSCISMSCRSRGASEAGLGSGAAQEQGDSRSHRRVCPCRPGSVPCKKKCGKEPGVFVSGHSKSLVSN